jgi:hypothetical protein
MICKAIGASIHNFLMNKPTLMGLSMGLERFVQNLDDRKIKEIELCSHPHA